MSNNFNNPDWRALRQQHIINPAAGLTIIESPHAGAVTHNLAYARNCLRHSIEQGEVPFASHLLYTQYGVLRDDDYEQRQLGIDLGFHFYRYAARCAVYTDQGISPGMERGIAVATSLGVPIVHRSIYTAPTPTDEKPTP